MCKLPVGAVNLTQQDGKPTTLNNSVLLILFQLSGKPSADRRVARGKKEVFSFLRIASPVVKGGAISRIEDELKLRGDNGFGVPMNLARLARVLASLQKHVWDQAGAGQQAFIGDKLGTNS